MVRSVLTAILLAQVLAFSPAQADLTGEWTDENGACYRVRQVDNRVYWYMDASPWVSNVFSGLLVGAVINGRWADLPGYQLFGNGTLSLRVESDVRMVKITAGIGSAFWGSEWRKGKCGRGGGTTSWSYGGGTATVTETGNSLTMSLNTRRASQGPHYRISATLTGRTLRGRWEFLVREFTGDDQKFQSPACWGGSFVAEYNESKTQITVQAATEDPCNHQWHGLTFTKQ